MQKQIIANILSLYANLVKKNKLNNVINNLPNMKSLIQI